MPIVVDAEGSGQTANPMVDHLRKEMAAADGGRGVSAYIIPTEDPHMVKLSKLATMHVISASAMQFL